MRYYKRETIEWDGDSYYFREDENMVGLDDLDDSFFPVKISLVTKDEYVAAEGEDAA